jgi:formate hydrogenlyase subunit 6/NADH:ubiquinone oxidoreductase subunit I
MKKGIYQQLREQMDHYMLGMPASPSQIELELLKDMFTPEDAEMFTHLTAELKEPEVVAQKAGQPLAAVADKLEDMACKGLVFRHREGKTARYSAIPFMFGLVEFQLKRLGKKAVAKLGQYVMERYAEVLWHSKGLFMRTIPVQKAVNATHHVAPYDDALEILKSQTLIVVTDCVCAKNAATIEGVCRRPTEVCFTFGPMAEYYLENGWGRKVDIDEAKCILDKAHDAGLITQPSTAQNPFGMCNCCSNCCGPLTAFKLHPRPAELVSANYQVQVIQEQCTGCGTCVERCPIEAVTVWDDGLAAIDLDRCIGCGLCVTTCPEVAVVLGQKPEHQLHSPPINTRDQMKHLARQRNLDETDPDQIVTFGFENEQRQ